MLAEFQFDTDTHISTQLARLAQFNSYAKGESKSILGKQTIYFNWSQIGQI